MKEPRWIDHKAFLQLHAQSIGEHGGSEGLRDDGLLESALARPQNLYAYENVTDLARLGASYAFGLAHNHAFIDGNKRAAFLSIGLFLSLNGKRLKADKVEAYQVMLSLATGSIDETQLAVWIEANMQSAKAK